MSKSELVVFGRSPFVNLVDIPALLEQYTTVGLNHFGRHHKVDHLFFYDQYCQHQKTTVYIPNWFPAEHAGVRYVPKPLDYPLMSRISQDGAICLGHKYYTVSLAINWALLEGYKRIYLVGIDHVETDRSFSHHDGIDGHAELTPDTHQALKKFIHNCAAHAEIYQCNPAVKDGWELPYKDVNELYG